MSHTHSDDVVTLDVGSVEISLLQAANFRCELFRETCVLPLESKADKCINLLGEEFEDVAVLHVVLDSLSEVLPPSVGLSNLLETVKPVEEVEPESDRLLAEINFPVSVVDDVVIL